MVKPWPIEIDGLPINSMVDLPMAMLNNQMVQRMGFGQFNFNDEFNDEFNSSFHSLARIVGGVYCALLQHMVIVS